MQAMLTGAIATGWAVAGLFFFRFWRRTRDPFDGRWALPGGFVDVEQDKTLLACARRKLKEKTGVATPYLEQLGSWGGATRDPRGWSATHAYFALIAEPAPESGAAAA